MHDVPADVKKKKFLHKMMNLIIGCLVVIGLVIYAYYWGFIDMGRLPSGEYLTESTSADGKYTLKAYVTNGGATTAFAVRGELVFNFRSNKTKNIYWNNHENAATILWSDNDTVVINGHEIDVPNGKYDFRTETP